MTVRFPTTGAIAGDLYGMVLRELTLCKTTSEETVVIFTDTRTNTNYAAAFLAAAKEVAATAFEIKIPLLPRTAGGDTDVAPVVGDSEDGPARGGSHHCRRPLPLRQGSRRRAVRRHPGAAGPGHRGSAQALLSGRGRAATDPERGLKLEQAGEIRVTTDTGTDLSMRKDGRRGVTQYGISDLPGRWDSWPSGFLYCAPLEDSANGTLMLDPGDLLVMLGRYVQQPVRIDVKDGRITGVEGGVDAILLQEHLDQSGDSEAFIISHIGWGTDPRARWVKWRNAAPKKAPGTPAPPTATCRSPSAPTTPWAGRTPPWPRGPDPAPGRFPSRRRDDRRRRQDHSRRVAMTICGTEGTPGQDATEIFQDAVFRR